MPWNWRPASDVVLAVDRVVGVAGLALLRELGARDRVRDQLQPDLGVMRGEPSHPADDAHHPRLLASAADGDEHVERELGRVLHRREQAESGRADVLDLPRAAGACERRDATRPELAPELGLGARAAEDRELHRVAEIAVRVGVEPRQCHVRAHERRDVGEPDDGVHGAARGLALAVAGERPELGVDAAFELDEERQLFAVRGLLARAGLASHRLLQHDPVLPHQRVQGPQVDEQHAAFERRQRTALQSRAAGEIHVERRGRPGLQREPQRLAPFLELRRRPTRSALARGCRGRRASAPGPSGTGARSSSGRPSRRAAAGRARCATRRRA